MNSLRSAYRDPADFVLRRQIGQNVRSLRRVANLSQTELARRVGVRPGPLNNIERGRHVPSGRLLVRLADALNVAVDEILGRDVGASHVREPAATYLASAAAGSRPFAQPMALRDDKEPDPAAERDWSELVDTILALEDACGAQKSASVPLRHPFTPDDRGLEALAQQVRMFLGVGHAVIFDYLELFENVGLRVVFLPLPEGVGSVAYYDGVHGNAFFLIEREQNVERQLFELAKRLGAVYLHTAGPLCGTPRAGLPDSLRAARKFAAFFLMPEAAVRATVWQLGVGPGGWTWELLLRIKHRFGVSAEAFLIRLRELGLVEEALAARLKARILRHYKHTDHGEPDGSRRVLSPNGRLGDLIEVARRGAGSAEARRAQSVLKRLGMEAR